MKSSCGLFLNTHKDQQMHLEQSLDDLQPLDYHRPASHEVSGAYQDTSHFEASIGRLLA